MVPTREPHAALRILMTADTVGGVWTYALELARALQPHGVEITLATMGTPLSSTQAEAADRLANVTVHASTYQLEWMEDPWDEVEAAGEWLLELEAQVQPDLVHLNNYAHGALPWNVPVLVVGHSCVYSWFDAVKGEPPPDDPWARYHEVVARGLRAADRVTAPTQAMLDALTMHYGDFATAEVVYNGRRPSDFMPAAAEPFVLTAGRLWDEAKNVGALAEVAPRLDWPVYVAGEDEHPVGGEVCLDGVRPLGQLASTELAAWMGRASIFALPARYEPFGLSALEAALAGCALVLGDLPSLREVWGEAAWFVHPDDTDALEVALQTLIRDRARREALAHRARARAMTYTPARMARGYRALYDALLRQPALPKQPAMLN